MELEQVECAGLRCLICHWKIFCPSEENNISGMTAGTHNQVVAMAVERDETGDGWKRGVVAELINRPQASNPLLESNLACLMALQDVSCRNAKLPVESPKTSCRKPRTSCRRWNLDSNVIKPWEK